MRLVAKQNPGDYTHGFFFYSVLDIFIISDDKNYTIDDLYYMHSPNSLKT